MQSPPPPHPCSRLPASFHFDPHALQGTDALTTEVLRAHEISGDKLELYWLRNIFNIPEDCRDAVYASLVRSIIAPHRHFGFEGARKNNLVHWKSSYGLDRCIKRPRGLKQCTHSH